MARLHILTGWMLVLGFFTAVSVHAADRPLTKPFAEKATTSVADKKAADANPFADPSEKAAKAEPATKEKEPPEPDPFADPPEKASRVKPVVKEKPVKQPKQASFVVKRKPAKAPAKKPHGFAHRDIPPGGNVAAIERALASPAHLEFVDAPLQDVVDYLKDIYQVEIQVDRRILEDIGISSDRLVTINVQGITLKSALRLMLRNMQPELAFMIRDEVLLITEPDVVAQNLVTKVYPVGDIVACRDEHDAPWDDYDALIDVITSTIKPTTWDTVGAPSSVIGNTFGTAQVLVVSQTDEVHEEIADLLAKIREIAKNSPNAGPPRRNRPTQPSGNRLSGMAGAHDDGMRGGMGGGMF
jgi:hypothetical protein